MEKSDLIDVVPQNDKIKSNLINKTFRTYELQYIVTLLPMKSMSVNRNSTDTPESFQKLIFI